MSVQEIYRETHSWVAKGKKVKVQITYQDLEKIIKDFETRSNGFEEFKKFAGICRDEPYRINPQSPFRDDLHAAINKFMPNTAQSIDQFIIEELLRRQGLNVDWSRK